MEKAPPFVPASLGPGVLAAESRPAAAGARTFPGLGAAPNTGVRSHWGLGEAPAGVKYPPLGSK